MENCTTVKIEVNLPRTLSEDSENEITHSGHSHAIEKASTRKAGIVKLNDTLDSLSKDEALTANQGRELAERIEEVLSASEVGAINKTLDAALAVLATRYTSAYATYQTARDNVSKHPENALIYVVNDPQMSFNGLWTVVGGKLVKAPWDALSSALTSEPFEVLQSIFQGAAGEQIEYEGKVYDTLATFTQTLAEGKTYIQDVLIDLARSNNFTASYLLTESGEFQQEINDTRVVAVDSIADLLEFPEGQRKEGLVYLVKGYHSGSGLGGGEFYWSPGTPKSSHNGGTVFDPLAVAEWDKTHADLPSFFSVSNSGYGCFVRQYSQLYCEFFGLSTSLSADNSPCLEKAISTMYGERKQNQALVGSFSHSAIHFLGNTYLFRSTINLMSSTGSSRFLYLIGDGTTVLSGLKGVEPSDLTLFEGNNLWKLKMQDIQFDSFNRVLHCSTGNLAGAIWEFNRVTIRRVNIFADQISYNLSRSTLVSFDNCVAGIISTLMITYSDKTNISGGFYDPGGAANGPFLKGNSNFCVEGILWCPSGDFSPVHGRCFIYLTDDSDPVAGTSEVDANRGVRISGGRFSNEGGAGPLVVCDYKRFSANSNAGSPPIVIENANVEAFTRTPFEEGNSESGVVYLKNYPAFVSFDNVNLRGGQSPFGMLVAKSDSLSLEDAPNFFGVYINQATKFSAIANSLSYSSIYSESLPALSMRGFINNPDPATFRGLLEDGLIPCTRIEPDKWAADFDIRTGYGSVGATSPTVFMLTLSGQGAESWQNGSSTYIVSLVTTSISGSARQKLNYTELHKDLFGTATPAFSTMIEGIYVGPERDQPHTPLSQSALKVRVVFGEGLTSPNVKAKITPITQRLSVFTDRPKKI